MRLAVLSFATSGDIAPAFGRQYARLISEFLRIYANADVQDLSLTGQTLQDGVPVLTFAPLDAMVDIDNVLPVLHQSSTDLYVDGELKETDGALDLTYRVFKVSEKDPVLTETRRLTKEDLVPELKSLIDVVAKQANLTVDQAGVERSLQFTGRNGDEFMLFCEAMDAIAYLQQANGAVTKDFEVLPLLHKLLESLKANPSSDRAAALLSDLGRAAVAFGTADFREVQKIAQEAITIAPESATLQLFNAEVSVALGDAQTAMNSLEKAIAIDDQQSFFYQRLAQMQAQLGMPVNAERNLKKALELEGEDKPSLQGLSQVLSQSGRQHEFLQILRDYISEYPQNPSFRILEAQTLVSLERQAEALRAMEQSVKDLNDPLPAKRAFAPFLAQNDEVDLSLDYFEDVLDANPTDIESLFGYAQALQVAGREFEIPKVLRNVLNLTNDPNARAQANKWLLDLEQPQRVERVKDAEQKLNDGNPEGAIGDLKPLKSWLGDYWPLWVLLGTAQFQTGALEDSVESAKRAIDLFPTLEPAHNLLATALLESGNAEEAYQVARGFASRQPISPDMLLILAKAAKASGKDEEARQMASELKKIPGASEKVQQELAALES
ncbi:MAG: tetratricopeptide repeat protein [Fimbriimonadaceae bacterium]